MRDDLLSIGAFLEEIRGDVEARHWGDIEARHWGDKIFRPSESLISFVLVMLMSLEVMD